MFLMDFVNWSISFVIWLRQCCWEQDQHSTSSTCSAEAKEWRISDRLVPEEGGREEGRSQEEEEEGREEEEEEERGRAMSMKAEFWIGRRWPHSQHCSAEASQPERGL